jgi:hypothetical protein
MACEVFMVNGGQFTEGGRTTVHLPGIQIASFLRCNKRTAGCIINLMVADNERLAAVGINDWPLQNQR